MIDFSTYKFRCSSLGEIISPSGKTTETMKTYLKTLHIEVVYGIKKDITSKYFEKGIICETDGLDALNKCLYPNKFITKNQESFSNEYICGTPDAIIDSDLIWDIKNAWDIFTFGNASLNHKYKWQLHGYSMLTGIENSGLFYFLADMPENLMTKEETILYYQGKFNDVSDPKYIEAVELLRKKYDYSKFTIDERFKVWFQYFKKEDEQTIIDSVQKARMYLMEIEAERMETLLNNKKLIEKCRKQPQ